MKMPSVTISFTEVATAAVKRGERGIIAMILKDIVPAENPVRCVTEEDIPAELSEAGKQQIRLALKGYVNTPNSVIVYMIGKSEENYETALNYLKTVRFDYLVAPSVETDGQLSAVTSYVKNERKANKLIKAVLPNATADSEGIINYATETVYENDTEYTTEQYCSRIAGIIAGTPITISCTYAPLPELTDCTRLTSKEADTAAEAGKLIVWWDGEKVKTGRGINSLTTLTDEKGEQFQTIKIVETMDMITNDIRMTAEDSYIGKYANTYDNKCLLVSAIGNYFEKLQKQGVLNSWTLEINVEANRAYLKEKGSNVDKMTEDEIKKANTGKNVFLKAKLSILDAIEDIDLPIAI